tara:strand:+ start:848 stop:1729 length:882 start_codon:yes stop_codon:yes gene_type:complete
MKALVTGGAGFIGSNLVDKLLEDDHDVVVFDNETANTHDGYYWNDKAENYHVDLSKNRSSNLLQTYCKDLDCIFHMAADISVQYSIESPFESYSNNINSLFNVLEFAKRYKIGKVVFSSSASVYGVTDKVCLETDATDPLNAYALSKLNGEQIMKMYHDLYGINTVSLRYFNVYGPRQSNTGQYAPVVGIFQKQKESNGALTIVGDGKQTRDFVHVSDVVSANMLVADRDVNGVYNVGTGVEYSVNQIADLISDDQVYIPARVGEARRSVADISKIKSIGWRPNVKLEEWIGS